MERRWLLPILVIAIPVVVLVVTRAQASVSPAVATSVPLDTVVLTGSYSCVITEYPLPQPVPPTTDPPPDPIIVHEFSHAISINGTGGVVTANNPPVRGIGPGFGGRVGSLPTTPLNVGSGIGASFDEGTIEDCRRFGEAIRSIASRLGCETSQLYAREQSVLSYDLTDVRFSFVCEGRSADQIHAIGELDRSLLLLKPTAAE